MRAARGCFRAAKPCRDCKEGTLDTRKIECVSRSIMLMMAVLQEGQRWWAVWEAGEIRECFLEGASDRVKPRPDLPGQR